MIERFHIWLPNSGIAFLITLRVQTHPLCLNLDNIHVSLAKHSHNVSHNLVLQLHLIKCTFKLFCLGRTQIILLSWNSSYTISSLLPSLFLQRDWRPVATRNHTSFTLNPALIKSWDDQTPEKRWCQTPENILNWVILYLWWHVVSIYFTAVEINVKYK